MDGLQKTPSVVYPRGMLCFEVGKACSASLSSIAGDAEMVEFVLVSVMEAPLR